MKRRRASCAAPLRGWWVEWSQSRGGQFVVVGVVKRTCCLGVRVIQLTDRAFFNKRRQRLRARCPLDLDSATSSDHRPPSGTGFSPPPSRSSARAPSSRTPTSPARENNSDQDAACSISAANATRLLPLVPPPFNSASLRSAACNLKHDLITVDRVVGFSAPSPRRRGCPPRLSAACAHGSEPPSSVPMLADLAWSRRPTAPRQAAAAPSSSFSGPGRGGSYPQGGRVTRLLHQPLNRRPRRFGEAGG